MGVFTKSPKRKGLCEIAKDVHISEISSRDAAHEANAD